MKTYYYLSTCKTCQRILAELGEPADLKLHDIKTEPITAEQLDQLRALAGSYEALFTRRSMKYRAWGLQDKTLDESDYRDLILKEYTFLKRPVLLIGAQVFIGNAKATVAAAKEALASQA